MAAPAADPPRSRPTIPQAYWVERIRIRGVDRLLDAVSRNAHGIVQLAPGSLDAHLFCFVARGLEVNSGFTSLPLRSEGRTPAGVATLTIVLDAPGRDFVNGRAVEPGSVLVWRPNAAYDGITSAGYRWVSLLLPWEELPTRGRAGGEHAHWPWHTSLLEARLSDEEAKAVRLLLRDTQTRANGGRVALPAAAGEALRERWIRVAREQFGRATPSPRPSGPLWRATLDVRAAEQFMHERMDGTVYVGDLCRATSIPERTLQESFHRLLGLPPMAYLETLRLHAIYGALRRRGPLAPRSVAEAARRHGVHHLSRLASRFRAVFGQYPAEVLREARSGEPGRAAREGSEEGAPA